MGQDNNQFENLGEKTLLGALTNIKVHSSTVSGVLLFCRVVIGIFMIHHGIEKIIQYQELKGNFPDPFGIGRVFTLNLAIFIEVVFPLAIAFGIFTRIFIVPIVLQMFLVLVAVHRSDILNSGELAALFFSVYIILLVLGPGQYSIDAYIQKKLGNKRFWEREEDEDIEMV